jgi:hypothetical protein
MTHVTSLRRVLTLAVLRVLGALIGLLERARPEREDERP